MSEHCGWCNRVVPLACKSVDHASACDRFNLEERTEKIKQVRLVNNETINDSFERIWNEALTEFVAELDKRIDQIEADIERFRVIEARINTWIQACAEAGALRNYQEPT